jgi:hyperosmotically inducible periplasmic protein
LNRRYSLWAAGLLGLAAGCSNTAKGISQDGKVAAAASSEASEKMGEKAAQTMRDSNQSAGKMGRNVAAALEMTPRVKTALTADPEINDAKNHIDVDSKDGMVHLKGTVSSNALKTKAGEIATKAIKDGGGTDQVMNELTVK